MIFRVILAFLSTFPGVFAEAIRAGKSIEVAIGLATAAFLRRLSEIFGLTAGNLVAMTGAAELDLLEEEAKQ